MSMSMDRPPAPPRATARQLGAALALAWVCTLASAADAPKAPQATTPATPKAASVSTQRVYFASPQQGFDALIAALRKHDAAALARVLGPGHQRIVDSGDSVADRAASEEFVADFDRKHAIQMAGDAKAFLAIGETEWPMPIPLVKRASGWTFDAEAGAEELVARRIGRNELDAIQVCLAFIDMEREYAEADRNGDGTLEYAARLISSPGKRDGLYWPVSAGEPPSPAGPRLAEASPQQIKGASAAKPYHGYYYRVLTAQGKHAPGGARSYSLGGRLIGGIALLAWPASYLASGVKTFKCSADGIVYQKDLGPDTTAKAAKIVAFDPGPGWTPAK